MNTGSDDFGASPLAVAVHYRLCPRCARAVPTTSGERYCANDGTRLLNACPECHAPITSPYARYCVRCGHDLSHAARPQRLDTDR